MGTLHTISAPPPSVHVAGDRARVASAYFAVTVDAAADLREAPAYRNLPPPERRAKALAEQREFLDRFSDPGFRLALDLRLAAEPGAATPVSVTLLGRVWGGSAAEATARAEGLRREVRAALPAHVIATPVEDAGAVAALLTPLPAGPVDSAVITRHELISRPSRPDAGVSYYYSAGPFSGADSDWSPVYAALAASPVPVVLSVAVLPMPVPPPFAQTLRTLAAFYGRLARESKGPGGPYPGQPRLPPDPFAVDAEQAFRDFSARLSRQAFALRIQVSAARRLPPGIVETIAGALSPAEPAGGQPGPLRAVSACDVRRPASAAERRLAEYNLDVVNVAMLSGRQEIWGRPDPPDPQLALLAVLGDARDASCAFRFPVAVDGTVPGFAVRRGESGPSRADGHSERDGHVGRDGHSGPDRHSGAGGARHSDGPVIRLGQISGTGRDITVPLRSLTRPALIAGSADSGKTATARAILRQLWTGHRVPFLVIGPADPAGDYRALAAEPGFAELEVITAGDEDGRPLRFNPFAVPAGVRVGEHTGRLLTCFETAFGLCGPLPSVYRDALALTYLRAGFLAAERPTGRAAGRAAGPERTWPSVADFLAAMNEVTAGLEYQGEVRAAIDAASVGRVRQLVRGATGSVLLTDRPDDTARLLGHPVILELSPLARGDEQALLTALLLNAVTEHFRSVRGASAELVHVTLLEEAHRLLARSPGGTAGPDAAARERAAGDFACRLAENRGYGAGVIFAEQAPGKLVKDAIDNAGLKIMHRLGAADDRRALGAAMDLDETRRGLAARLRGGEALLTSGEFTEAAHADLRPAPGEPVPGATVPGLALSELTVAEPTRPGAVVPGSTVPLPGAVRPSASPPFAACGLCRAQCTYRGAALSLLDDPRTVAAITEAARALETADGTPAAAEDPAGAAELRGLLHATVARFAALPAADPGRSDAAFCLFLHVQACSRPRSAPEWPPAAARLLGLIAPTDLPA